MKTKNRFDNLERIIAAVISISAFLLLWQMTVSFTSLGRLLPGPIAVFSRFIISFVKPIGPYTIIGHVLWSLSRVMMGFLSASFAGIILGLAMGYNRSIEAILKPVFEIIRPIPPIAWTSLAILWFGLGESSKYFIIFLSGFSNIVINVHTGARAVDPELIGAARMLGARKGQIFTTIVMPSSVPYIFTGLQIAISSSWAAVVAAEMIRSTEGVGWLITSGMGVNDTAQTLIGIISIGFVGFSLATIMRGVEAKLCQWTHSGG